MQSTFPPLSDFSHRGAPRATDPRARLTAFVATVLVYGLMGLLALTPSTWLVPLKEMAAPRYAMVRLLPLPKPQQMPIQDFAVRMISPKAENAPLPEIVIKPDISPSPAAALPVTAARDTAMAGGAAPGSSGAAVSGIGTGGSGNGMSACMDPAYLQAINRHVMHWYDYPGMARNLRITGIVYVHFVIDRSGHYKELSLAQGSGSNFLDASAMSTMRRSEPLPPIPERFHLDQLDGLLPIVYQLTNVPLTARRLGSSPSGC